MPPQVDSKVGTLITDGTVTWIVDDVRDGTPVGSVRGSLYLPKGYIKANGATVNRADYPRLVKWINDNNLWTDDTAGNLGMFGKGDNSTTFVLPNLVGRIMQLSDSGGVTISAGLPDINGNISIYGYDDWSTGAFLFGSTNTEGWFTENSWSPQGGTNNRPSGNFKFKASNSSPIYGASTTVQPPAITYLPIIRY